MKLNVLQALVNFDGKPMKENRQSETETENGRPKIEVVDLILRSVINTCLMHTTEEEQKKPDADARLHRFILAQEVYKNDTATLLAEDVVFLKKRVNLLFQTQVVGAFMLLVEPESVPTK